MEPKITIIMPVYNAEDTLLRALNSLPLDKQTQFILLDDGSTDKSWQIALDWWKDNIIDGTESIIHRWEKNRGVAKTINLGLSLAQGEYVVYLSSDDYFLLDFADFMPYLDGQNDLVYFNLEVNDGSIWGVNEESKDIFVGGVKFMRREFIGDTRNPDKKWHEDKDFYAKLQAKEPKEIFTGIVLKHYDWPREGSLSWQANH
ncbi:glycosyltransferase family 2 protein [Candidatus Saccharibacteria bacterium]|nr:glycosyltransferase family 2 protein [Candidatus Saccharibacteria bacterium]